jgi:hypothetical protein
MKLVDKNESFREMEKVLRVGFYLPMFVLFLGFFLGVNTLSSGSSPKDAKGSGILKYLPKHITDNLLGLNENIREDNLGDFVIFHSHDFENNTLGTYNNEEKRRDWGAIDYDNRPGYPQIVNFDGGKRIWNYYPQGSKGLQNGADFGAVIQNLSDEVYYSFRLYYEPGFDFYISGKLPGFRMQPQIKAGTGLNPGNNGAVVYLQVDQQGRMNWNIYHHKMTTNYGERMGSPYEFYTIETGKWIDVTYRIVLNTPGVANGILQVWIDGVLKNTATGVLLRTKTSVQNFNQQTLITFMDWDVAVRKNQSMYMDDFFTWKYSPEYLSSNPVVAKGLMVHPSSHKLITPLDQNLTQPLKYKLNTSSFPMEGGKVIIKPSGNE